MSRQSSWTLGGLLSSLFTVPENSGKQYVTGWQPNNPGEASTPGWVGGQCFGPIPWPTAVPTFNMMASDPGTPRMRGGQPDVNQYAPLFQNYMFIGGFSGKSKG